MTQSNVRKLNAKESERMAKRKKRPTAIAAAIVRHPEWSYERISREFAISAKTVLRVAIIRGLQRRPIPEVDQ